MLVCADNSPAQWAFTKAYEGNKYSIADIRRLLAEDDIPFAFAIKRDERPKMRYKRTLGGDSVNSKGWKLCHIDDIGLRTRNPIEEIEIENIAAHFRLFLAPSNHFLIPLEWSGLGEVPEVITATQEFEHASLARIAKP